MIWATLNELDEEVKIKPKQPQAQIPREVSVGKSDWILATDVYQSGSNVVIKINLPGIDADKVDISVSADAVKISGHAEDEERIEGGNYFMREIRRGSFERIIKLPVRVEMDRAEADYTKGILKITVPRKEEGLVNKIRVRNSSN
ncbi:MAG: Hsp20/alpha crystallin family protein [bacterium]